MEEIKFDYIINRKGIGKSPYEATFRKDRLQEMMMNNQDENGCLPSEKVQGLYIGYYVRTDNQKTRYVRRFDKYKKAGYKKGVKDLLQVDIEEEEEDKGSDDLAYQKTLEDFLRIGTRSWSMADDIIGMS